MARSLSHSLSPERMLAIAIVASLGLSLAPTRHTQWVSWFGALTVRLVAPVTHPISTFTRWISPPATIEDDPDSRLKLEDAERFRTLYLRAMSQNAVLRARIEFLQSGVALNPDRPISLLSASVISVSSNLRHSVLNIRRGTEVGIEPNTVATVQGTRLLGRVVRADRSFSEILPITDPASPPLLGRIILIPEDGRGRRCTLEPQGDGTLVGIVEDPREQPDLASIKIEPGMTVRLDDGVWPAHAQMLELGRVEKIEISPDNPLRSIVIVRPRVELSRVSEIELRISREQSLAREDGS